jgi:hypothetical protein
MAAWDDVEQWDFVVAAAPDACIPAFRRAMNAKSTFNPRQAIWTLSVDGLTATATYRGRGRLGARLAALWPRRPEQEWPAIATHLRMQIWHYDDVTGSTECSLWVAHDATTPDVRAPVAPFRSYMSEVESALRALDSGMWVTKE